MIESNDLQTDIRDQRFSKWFQIRQLWLCSLLFLHWQGKKLTCLPYELKGQKQFLTPDQAGSICHDPSQDWTRRLLSEINKMTTISQKLYQFYLCCSTFVPCAVVEYVLPLLQNQYEVEIFCLKIMRWCFKVKSNFKLFHFSSILLEFSYLM